MTHLDDLAAALVDNELDHDARDRALAHITRCGPCRAEVDAQRRLKAMLANQPVPEVTIELTARLLVLSRTATGPVNDVVRLRRRPSRRRAATYSALSVALLAGVAVAGGQSTQPSVRPPVQSFVDEHNATTTRVGYNDAGTVVMTSFGR